MPTDPRALSVLKALLRHKSVLLFGPPGTGKTHLLRDVQTLFEGDLTLVSSDEERDAIRSMAGGPSKVAFVTFHQSFGYEDFVVGLRPDPGAQTALLALKPTPGVLLEMSEHARQADHRSLLLVDEINRGNASRIFGEFITLLDSDKRLFEDGTSGPQTVRLRLPYQAPGRPLKVDLNGAEVDVPAPFTMPSRLYLLATMNSVDKSVAPLDAALRRRFHVERIGPDLDAIANALGIATPVDPLPLPATLTQVSELASLAVALLRALNRGIAAFLGPDFQLGHWFLAPLVGSSDFGEMQVRLFEVWENRLLPQLEEYFQGRSDQLRVLLASPGNSPLSWRAPAVDLEEVGAIPVLERRAVPDSDLINFLRVIAGVTTPP